MSMTTPIDQFKGKQLDIINWWRRYPDKQTIIADGAVRSGKTFAMSISYVLWSMIMFDREQFGIAGKTIGSLRRNVIRPLKQTLQQVGFSVVDRRSENMLEISLDGRTNLYYLFGGKDGQECQWSGQKLYGSAECVWSSLKFTHYQIFYQRLILFNVP